MENNPTNQNMKMQIIADFSPVRVACENEKEREHNLFVRYFYEKMDPIKTFDDFRNFVGKLDFDRYQTYKFTLYRDFNMDISLASGNVVAGKPSEDYYYNRNGVNSRNRVFDSDGLGLLEHYNISYDLIVVQDKLPSVKEVLAHEKNASMLSYIHPESVKIRKKLDKKIAQRAAYYVGDCDCICLFNPAKTVCVDRNLVEIRFPFSAEEMKNGFPGPGPIVYVDEQYKTGKIPESLEGFFSESPVLSIQQAEKQIKR